MATITRTLSPKDSGDGTSEIMLRLTIGRGKQFRIKSGVYVAPSRFRAGGFRFPRLNTPELARLRAKEAELAGLERHLLEFCRKRQPEGITSESVKRAVEAFRNPCAVRGGADFNNLLDQYLNTKTLSVSRVKQYEVLRGSMAAFLSLRRLRGARGARLNALAFTEEDVAEFEHFLSDEHNVYESHPEIYPAGRRRPQPRGRNTTTGILKLLRAVFNWCHLSGLMEHDPFLRYSIARAVYGTPYYITLAERDLIEYWDFSHDPALGTQRDIFIFQSYIGCRVSDLCRLTRANVVDGAVEYIPVKTREERAEVVRVPLHPRALAILRKYEDGEGARLFPFISPQRYNDRIKEIFTACGLTRTVSIINPLTGAEERHPLNEVASSHLARRTFVGNLYRQVKDPALVGRLSGHKEGSQAFSRYRDIDEELRRDVVSLLGPAGYPDAEEGAR